MQKKIFNPKSEIKEKFLMLIEANAEFEVDRCEAEFLEGVKQIFKNDIKHCGEALEVSGRGREAMLRAIMAQDLEVCVFLVNLILDEQGRKTSELGCEVGKVS
jgi:hypothetical protein